VPGSRLVNLIFCAIPPLQSAPEFCFIFTHAAVLRLGPCGRRGAERGPAKYLTLPEADRKTVCDVVSAALVKARCLRPGFNQR